MQGEKPKWAGEPQGQVWAAAPRGLGAPHRRAPTLLAVAVAGVTYSQTKVPRGMSCRDRTPQPMFCVR